MPTRKERDEYLKGLNPIDDLMFRKMAEHKEFCEEILRVILGDDELIVTENMHQFDIKNLQGRSVVLDAKCFTGDGQYINIEVQKANDDNHLKRVRYNASVLTANIAESGQPFGKIEDGLSEIYVNAAVDDGSMLAKLMKVFTKNDAYNNADFPVTSGIKARFKLNEGGTIKMDETLQRWRDEWISEGEERGEKRGEKRGAKNEKLKIAKTMIEEGLETKLIMKYTGLSEEAIVALQG